MKKDSVKKREKTQLSGSALRRRDLMKLGVGAGVAAMTQVLHAPGALAQEAGQTITASRGRQTSNGSSRRATVHIVAYPNPSGGEVRLEERLWPVIWKWADG